jgi:quercetin dioxygenase-like cupin family protein
MDCPYAGFDLGYLKDRTPYTFTSQNERKMVMKKSLWVLLFITMTILVVMGVQIIGKTAAAAGPQQQKAAARLDAVKADPKHYKVEYENESIRVLRVTLGPHEKTPMHFHPANLNIDMNQGQIKHTFPDGKSETGKGNPEGFGKNAAVTHSSENLGDQKFEAFLIELKGKEKP